MAEEQHWTSQISNETICGFFNTFYWVYVVLSVITLFVLLYSMIKMSGSLRIVTGLTNFLVLSISATMMLFHSLICERALGIGSSRQRA
jgi:uncharacterized membrane protein